MIRNTLIILASSMFLASCAASLTSEGKQVVLVTDKAREKCEYIGVVTASNSMGYSTGHDAEGTMNELRNKAANEGANAIKIVNVDSDYASTTGVAEALYCDPLEMK